MQLHRKVDHLGARCELILRLGDVRPVKQLRRIQVRQQLDVEVRVQKRKQGVREVILGRHGGRRTAKLWIFFKRAT